jgi:hypothetical protein
MNQKEFESVINLPANIRYEYFIKRGVDSEEAKDMRARRKEAVEVILQDTTSYCMI